MPAARRGVLHRRPRVAVDGGESSRPRCGRLRARLGLIGRRGPPGRRGLPPGRRWQYPSTREALIGVGAIAALAAASVIAIGRSGSRAGETPIPADAGPSAPAGRHDAGDLRPRLAERRPAPAAPRPLPLSATRSGERIERAREHEARGELERAAQEYQLVLETDGQSAEAHAGLGRVLMQRDALVDAERSLARAVELDPDDASARVDLAVVRARLLRYRDARVELDAALAIAPEGTTADIAHGLLEALEQLEVQR